MERKKGKVTGLISPVNKKLTILTINICQTKKPKHDINLANLMCLPIFSSWFGTPVEENKRLIKVKCYSKEGIVNFYMKPVEGFSALVDMHKKEVLVVSNNGQNIPVAKGINNTSTTKYHCSIQKLNRELRMLNPISLEQPKGPSFIIDGHLVRDPDSSKLRSVMYKGFTSELFVPYMDPIEVTEVRPKVTLVVRMATSLVNYNYIMDWEFQTDRPIKAKVSDEN
ncbi:Primary amine oxidase [Glycine max]|nr:Primary amine oxidase [Glycine max]